MKTDTDIRDLLPEELSDESAYHLVTFLTKLATTLESCYFAQMRRHFNSTSEPRLPDELIDNLDDEFPF